MLRDAILGCVLALATLAGGCIGGEDPVVDPHEEAIEGGQVRNAPTPLGYWGSCDADCACPPPRAHCWLIDCGCSFSPEWVCGGRCSYDCDE